MLSAIHVFFYRCYYVGLIFETVCDRIWDLNPEFEMTT